MTKSCEHLEPLINLALSDGCAVVGVSEGWSIARRVVELGPRFPDKLKSVSSAVQSPLRYYRDAGSPHNAPDQGFFCDTCKVGLSFPSKRVR